MIEQPIGVFDSGIGGLTVVSQIRKYCPGEEIVYFGDTARVPYGTKSANVIRQFSVENTRFLLKSEPKLIVIACHTASCLAGDYLRRKFPGLTFLDVVRPSIEKALAVTRSGRIGLIGTPATINSGHYQRLLSSRNRSVHIFAKACPLFVPLVEEGWISNSISKKIAAVYLNDFKKQKIDTLILACTHYPLLKKVIGRVLGKKVELVDASEEVAWQVKEYLRGRKILKENGARKIRLYFSDCHAHLKSIIPAFLHGERITIREAAFPAQAGRGKLCTRL